ncbi:flagellar hook-basal body complex protein FliE [Marinovum sp.]|uniref:flagellar hook-basal body complex protein FliE n=1 Tax=Marinovum sp. TaxID=2024839 RepID=UPI002B26519C|nr:flagellar hook-basal body complex protein FliE [Marinovum sp.]
MADPTTLTSINAASGAYRNARDMAGESTGATEGTGFAEMLAQSGRDTVTAIREAEAAAVSGLHGGTDTQAVVEATLELETTVQMAVSVRDKLVEAYKQILNMPV